MKTPPPLPLNESSPSRHQLGLWDVISLLIGIVVGVSIFRVPPLVFDRAGSPETGLIVWGVGAVLALIGAMCYAELAATYPGFGAEYIYLGRAFGRPVSFLFGWMQTFVILPGSVGAMAFVFATYASQFLPDRSGTQDALAGGAIALLCLLHLIGFQSGRRVQNLLTTIKVTALVGILVCGLILPVPERPAEANLVAHQAVNWTQLGLPLVLVLYSYGGWSDVAVVTADVRDCQRNMPRALAIGLGLTAALYLLLNLAYLRVLGYSGVCQSEAPAADVVERTLRLPAATGLMRVVVMISALGAIHGMIFSGSRLLAAIGADFPIFRRWNIWNRNHVPFWSVSTVGGVSILMTAILGTVSGRTRLQTLLTWLHLPVPDWSQFGGSFDVFVAASAPYFWIFFGMSGIALIRLRSRDRDRSRPFKVPGYPLTPLLFILTSAFMLWSSLNYAGWLTLMMLPVLGLGILLAAIQRAPEKSE